MEQPPGGHEHGSYFTFSIILADGVLQEKTDQTKKILHLIFYKKDLLTFFAKMHIEGVNMPSKSEQYLHSAPLDQLPQIASPSTICCVIQIHILAIYRDFIRFRYLYFKKQENT